MVLVLSALTRRVLLKSKVKHTYRRIVLDGLLTWYYLYFSALYPCDHLSWLGMDFMINFTDESILNAKYTTVFNYNNFFQNYISF